MTSATVTVGDVAPDFALRNQHGQTVRLRGLRGQSVVLVFYPWAFSGICTGELCALRDDFGAFEAEGAQLLAVSCDSMFSLRAYAEQQGYPFQLLADFWPHGETARAYGVFDERAGCALRGSFVIDPEGVVRWAVVNGIPDARDLEEYKRAIAEIAA